MHCGIKISAGLQLARPRLLQVCTSPQAVDAALFAWEAYDGSTLPTNHPKWQAICGPRARLASGVRPTQPSLLSFFKPEGVKKDARHAARPAPQIYAPIPLPGSQRKIAHASASAEPPPNFGAGAGPWTRALVRIAAHPQQCALVVDAGHDAARKARVPDVLMFDHVQARLGSNWLL